MPELPDVEIYVELSRERLVGSSLEAVRVNSLFLVVLALDRRRQFLTTSSPRCAARSQARTPGCANGAAAARASTVAAA